MKPGKKLLNLAASYTTLNAKNRRECFLNDIVRHFKWTAGAEIGVREGRTSFFLLDNNQDLSVYAVDKDITQFYNNRVQEKYKQRLIPLKGLSWEMADQVENSSLDFVFIDAGHGYKSVVKDIDAWKPKLKSTGWLMGHDINFPAVYQAVSEKFENFQIGPDNVWFISPDGNYKMLEKL